MGLDHGSSGLLHLGDDAQLLGDLSVGAPLSNLLSRITLHADAQAALRKLAEPEGVRRPWKSP